ncbi:hypothetical protein BN903_211 [Halorubrum sp. AJ67]|nr:hypothetical protein BN903_211 [Halorubrum sp. AJ67]
MWSGWVAADSVPVLVRIRPELDEQLLHPRELDVVEIASCGVMLVPLRVLVGVVVPDEREIVEGAQMERVLPARGVRSRCRQSVEARRSRRGRFRRACTGRAALRASLTCWDTSQQHKRWAEVQHRTETPLVPQRPLIGLPHRSKPSPESPLNQPLLPGWCLRHLNNTPSQPHICTQYAIGSMLY